MTTSTRPGTFVCCGVQIAALTRDPAAASVVDSHYGQPRSTHLCNAYTLSLAVRDPKFRALLNDADVNFADGHYVAMVGRRRGHPDMAARVYGPDLMADTIDQGRTRGLKHYLYGASPTTVETLAEKLAERFPGAEFVGVESPPFRPLNDTEADELVARVAEAKPDVFWVGLGTPRQDEFVAQYTKRLNCTVVPVGAAFDFHAGNKPSAPEFLQRHGMEWAYRLATEPRRLWKRYLVGNPVFIYGAATDRWRAARSERR